MTSSQSPSPESQTFNNTAIEVSRLKRRIATLQQEVNEAHGVRIKKNPTTITMGRGIRRLISLFEPIDTIIGEADYRLQVEEDGSQFLEPYTEEQYEKKLAADRTYKGYTLLLHFIPHFKSLVEDPEADSDDLDKFIALLQRGANDARSDDVRRIKEELGGWLNADFSPPEPFAVKSRADRGLQNDITGHLLCPIEHNWDDDKIRSDIRTGLLKVSDDFFLNCFYPKNKGNPNDLEANFLRSGLLIKTFCAIFTSPTSSESFDEGSDDGRAHKKQKTNSQKRATKTNVASLLHMEGKATPRSIAYAATILAFNLTDATQWVEVYNGFSYCVLYNFIIDYFEETPNEAAKNRADNLLKWWNRQVFPQHVAAVADSRKSRNKLAAQRAQID